MLGEDVPLRLSVRMAYEDAWRGSEGSITLGNGKQETVGEAEKVASGRRSESWQSRIDILVDEIHGERETWVMR